MKFEGCGRISILTLRSYAKLRTSTILNTWTHPATKMGRLLFGVLLLHILHSYGFDNKPPTWPKNYEITGRITSLTDGREERFKTYVADEFNKQLTRLGGDIEWQEERATDDIYITRKGKYDTIERYFLSFPGTVKPSCGTYNTSKSFAESYRLPKLSHPESKLRLSTVSNFYSVRLEHWYYELKIGQHPHIQESVWITYNTSEGSDKNWVSINKYYKEFAVPTRKLSVHKIYEYGEYRPTAEWGLDFFTPSSNTKWPERFKYSFANISCKKIEFPYVIDGSDSNKDKDETAARKKVFDMRSRMVERHNKENLSYKLELNRFAYMTDEELKVYANCNDDSRPDLKKLKNVVAGNSEQNITLPESINWRLNGAVTTVKNQENCASCWAFAVVGAMESFHYINSKDKELRELSEQMLIDCVWNLSGTISSGSRGCSGGKLEYGFEWISEFKGIQRTMEYGSYLGLNGLCSYVPTNLLSLKKFQYLQTESELKTALVQHGPVAVFIQADLNFMFYASGIYESKDGDIFTNHAALLVGYGFHNGKDYWLIKNSWGRVWGEDGYMKLSHPKSSSGVIKYGFVPVQ